MRIGAWVLLAAAAAGCGTPPNHRLATRTSDYLKAMSFGFSAGHPLDIGELERRFPELKGKVITAAQWVDEYERLREEASKRGESVYEYRIPPGAHLTIEVRGEPELTKTYVVPPNGYVHYYYFDGKNGRPDRLRLQGFTLDELRSHLESELRPFLRDPQVLVHVHATPFAASTVQPIFQQSFGTGEIMVLGVTRSRFFSNVAFTGKETLISVLGQTDFPPNMEWRQIRVIRRDKVDPLRRSRVIVCDIWDYFAKGDVRQDVPLFPGDVVYVPLRWSTDDQFWEDWTYVKRIINDIFFLDSFKDELKKGGDLRR